MAENYMNLLTQVLQDPEMTIRQLKDTLKSSLELNEQQEFADRVMRPVGQEF
jgi:hypothetical protein